MATEGIDEKKAAAQRRIVILNVAAGGVKDLLYLAFNIGAKRRSAIHVAESALVCEPLQNQFRIADDTDVTQHFAVIVRLPIESAV